jgi:ADP-ribose pyrophosphatase YjhB (NUDIX family)
MTREIEIKHCPRCAGKMTIEIPDRPGLEPRRVCSLCGLIWHADPKVAVAGILVREGRVLLVKRARPPQKDYWCLPGGFVDRGETMEGAAAREFVEETGLEVRAASLFGLYSYPGYPIVVGIYEMEPIGQTSEVCLNPECLESCWFPLDDIPWDRLAFPSTTDSLKELAAAFGINSLSKNR